MSTKKLTALSMLTAAALIIFIIESQLPPLAPIPGIKPGLANVITLVALARFGGREAFIVLMLRIVLGSMLVGQPISFMYGMAGGILCFLIMWAMWVPVKIFKDRIWVVSIFGAVFHNIGQIAAAVIITGTWQIVGYLPVLTVSGVITGLFTGFTAQFVIKRLGGG
ncbi:MAG: Gx transporter family protein [Oscillospiraceae bacterium]|nr:Gx transporter family protein [Oscillospiraceae bacterium]